MDNEDQVNEGGQQQEQQGQKQQPNIVGGGFNNVFKLGRGVFKLGRFGLNKRRKTPSKEAGEESIEAAESVVKKGLSLFLKRFSLFAFGISFFWFLIIFAVGFLILSIIFPMGGVIPDNVKALFPTSAPIPTRGIGGPGPGSGGGVRPTIPPITGAVTCPIPGGPITCGSQAIPISGCGHCGEGYEAYMNFCTYPGIYHAMDVGAPGGSPVYLPTIKGNVIKWSYLGEQAGATQAIQRYAGINEATGEQYYIQFHHTENGSGNSGEHQSGEVGAVTCGACGEGHVHIEFGSGDPSGVTWLEAPQYFCS